MEATLNSRPLTYLTADDLEEPLTPMHLITGCCLLQLPDLRATSEMDPDKLSSNEHANLTADVKCLSHSGARLEMVEVRAPYRA